MSRSYRKPYAAVTGLPRTTHLDKTLAARAVRRRLKCWVKCVDDFEAALIPHRRECAYNNTYGWARDGRQHLAFPYSRFGRSDEAALDEWIKLQRK